MSIENLIGCFDHRPYGLTVQGDSFVSKVTAVPEEELNALNNGKDVVFKKHNNKKYLATNLKSLSNSLNNDSASDFGYLQTIDTLTQIRQEVVQQKFFEVDPNLYFPVQYGFNPWGETTITYKEFLNADSSGNSGKIGTGNNSRIDEVDVAISPVATKQQSYAKQIQYSIIDINTAAKAGNWSLIQAKERALKKDWDLMIQRIGLCGDAYDSNFKGLLNQTGVAVDTSTIVKPISAMSGSELSEFASALVQKFYVNSNYTLLPDTFVLPSNDIMKFGSSSDANFHLMTKSQYLERAFTEAVKSINPSKSIKLLGLPYANKGNINNPTPNVNKYALYDSSQDSMFMNINVNYTSTAAGTFNNFQFQAIGYGQYSGLQLLRDRALMYFTNTVSI
jgi:hypothetical protein